MFFLLGWPIGWLSFWGPWHVILVTSCNLGGSLEDTHRFINRINLDGIFHPRRENKCESTAEAADCKTEVGDALLVLCLDPNFRCRVQHGATIFWEPQRGTGT